MLPVSNLAKCRNLMRTVGKYKGTVLGKKMQPAVKAIMESKKPQLPYDYFSLTWDSSHLSNEEKTYCYCGGPGEWCVKMLQCHQCKQWFHEKCIRCLDKKTLYFGDRFFIFLCSVCCEGPEILRRLELSWLDVVHLVIYNMTVIENKTYFEINESILPTVSRSINLLQLPREFVATSKVEREKIVLNVLHTNRRLFKCGREIRKRSSLWGLRSRAPPAVPDIHVNVEKLFAEKLTIQMNKKLDISRSSTPKRRSGRCDEVIIDASAAVAAVAAIPKFVLSEPKSYQTLLPTPPPEDLMPDCTFKKIRRSLKSVLNGIQKRPRSSSIASSNPKTKKPKRPDTRDAPKIVARKGTAQHGKNERLGSTGTNGFTTATNTTKQPRPSSPVALEDMLLGSLETLIPPLASFDGTNNPFYLPSDRLRSTKRKRHPSTNGNGLSPASTTAPTSTKRRCTRSSTGGGVAVKSEPNADCEGELSPLGATNGRVVAKVNGHHHHHHPKRNGEVTAPDKLDTVEPRTLRSSGGGPVRSSRLGRRKCVEEAAMATSAGERRSSADNNHHHHHLLRLNGSKCQALASRRSPGGKVQYLIEWNKIAD